MLLMTEKGIRGGILHTVPRHAKTNDRNMKNLMKPKILHFYYIQIKMKECGKAMRAKLAVIRFK